LGARRVFGIDQVRLDPAIVTRGGSPIQSKKAQIIASKIPEISNLRFFESVNNINIINIGRIEG
jgi:hypothetical protein